jgi:hypothetical protein
MTATQTCRTTPSPNGRRSDGRFTRGNAGGPGNPFYRRQAEFRRAALELFTPEDVMSLLRVMLALGRNGDVAAAKVFLEYVVGKPHKAPDPDRADHHEWQLQAEAPPLADVTGPLENGEMADSANDANSDTLPHLAAARPDGVFDALNTAPPSEPAVTEVTGDNGVPAAAAAGSARAPRIRETMRLLTGGLRAAVGNGDNGDAGEMYQWLADRLTGDNGIGCTVQTVANGNRADPELVPARPNVRQGPRVA